MDRIELPNPDVVNPNQYLRALEDRCSAMYLGEIQRNAKITELTDVCRQLQDRITELLRERDQHGAEAKGKAQHRARPPFVTTDQEPPGEHATPGGSND